MLNPIYIQLLLDKWHKIFKSSRELISGENPNLVWILANLWQCIIAIVTKFLGPRRAVFIYLILTVTIIYSRTKSLTQFYCEI